jgi:hypothetical protein
VPIPVDALAGMRGEAPGERHHVAIETPIDEDHQMSDNTPTPAIETAAPAVPVAAIQPTIVDHSSAVDEALRAERARSVALDEVLVTARGLVPDAVMQTIRTRAIAEAWTPAVLRGSLFDAMAAGQRPTMPAAPNGGVSRPTATARRGRAYRHPAVRALSTVALPTSKNALGSISARLHGVVD